MTPVSKSFLSLPQEVQQENLELIQKVNRLHLHCAEDTPEWDFACKFITNYIAVKYFAKQQKSNPTATPSITKLVPVIDKKIKKDRLFSSIIHIHSESYFDLLFKLNNNLQRTYHDFEFTDQIIEAAQVHLFAPLRNNGELLHLLVIWIVNCSSFLPLGEHLLPAFLKDMKQDSLFYLHVMKDTIPIPEAQSEQTLAHMRAFLETVRGINDRCRAKVAVNENEPPTVVLLSVKDGAGGHTAPHRAMAARIKELGYRMETIHYDTDLDKTYDPYRMLGITFEDNSPMTKDLIQTRWVMQKHNKTVSKIVRWYVYSQIILNPSLYRDCSGSDLLCKKILPLNPKLIITTLAYHWTWASLAFRLAGVKTLLVASDIFFHSRALTPWYRQKDLDPRVRNVHFTTMTDDIELLRSEAKAHDEYWRSKIPDEQIDTWHRRFEGLQLDEQITVIGAPINPLFEAVTGENEIAALRKKWEVPEDAVVSCISRGKLGYDVDLEEALEGYRTKKEVSRPLILHVVCGENDQFYRRLKDGEYNTLGPNITVVPHPLLNPKDFAEIRAISIVDDIKAGGASTFEGWYLISAGAKSKLILTPGPELWWEKCNCWAMEKWEVGSMVSKGRSKIDIIEELIHEDVKPIKMKFPDWKKPFDQIVKELMKA